MILHVSHKLQNREKSGVTLFKLDIVCDESFSILLFVNILVESTRNVRRKGDFNGAWRSFSLLE